MKIKRVISGAQSGADIGGLKAARDCGIPTAGWIPQGHRSAYENKEELRTFGLKETPEWNYQVRTRLNVRDSHLTLIFGDHTSPGCSLTKRCCKELNKPRVLITEFSDAELHEVYTLLDSYEHPIVVNIAGNREASFPGIENKVVVFLTKIFKLNEVIDG